MDINLVRLLTIVLAVFFGVTLSIVARHLRFPAIAPLLIGGIILGPEVLGLIDSQSFGDGLRLIIALSVATILFEGGLTLNPKGFKRAGGVISRLLTVGVLITWLGTAAAIYFVFEFSIPLSILAGSLIIVTGPTVITPMLQRLKIKENLHQILHWEGVLIDPIGVFIAILCFEWLSIEGNLLQHFMLFSYRLAIGLAIGSAGGFITVWMIKRKWIPEDQVNIFVLAVALFLFAISDALVHEAGILTVVIAGLVLGWKKPGAIKQVKQFKSELTEIAIGILFILLAANLDLNNFVELGWEGVILILIVLFLIRPLGILFSTVGSELTFSERTFLSWVAPRGVVAGSIASLFALQLNAKGNTDAAFLEAFTYSIIGVTIIVQGLLSGPVAGLLKVKAPPKQGWLIVGSHLFARRIADFISKKSNKICILIDTNVDSINEALVEGFHAYRGDALSTSVLSEELFNQIGNVIALTDNRDLNQLVCEKWSEFVESDHLYRWSPPGAEPHGEISAKGIPIWTRLPKPTQVAYDLRQKEVSLALRKPKKLHQTMIPLIAVDEGEFHLHSFKDDIKGDVLLFKQVAYHLPLVIKKDHIVLNLEADTYGDFLKKVFTNVFRNNQVLTPELVLDKFKENEANPYFVLGNNVAVPHAFFDNIDEELCIIVQIPNGLKLSQEKDELSKLFFILLNPVNNPEIHLMMLADIAKVASDPELVNKLISAKQKREIIKLLKDQDNY